MYDRACHTIENFVENPFLGQDCTDRHMPAGQRLGEQHHVGFDTSVLAGEKPAGLTKPSLYLVGDEQGPIFTAEVKRALEIAIVWNDHALSLNRLHDEGRDRAQG